MVFFVQRTVWCISVVISWYVMFGLCFCRLSCDQKVIVQLKSRTLGNSASRLYNTLREQHTDSWMRRAILYLGVCEQFLALCSVRGPFPPPPEMPPLPSTVWLLTVYGYDVLTRLDEYKARITSTFGSILKMDSTKKASQVHHCHIRCGYPKSHWVMKKPYVSERSSLSLSL